MERQTWTHRHLNSHFRLIRSFQFFQDKQLFLHLVLSIIIIIIIGDMVLHVIVFHKGFWRVMLWVQF